MVTELEYRRGLVIQQLYEMLIKFMELEKQTYKDGSTLNMEAVNSLISYTYQEINAIENADFSDNFNHNHREEQPF